LEIFKLFGSVLIDNDKANQSLDSTDKKAQGLGGKLGGMIGTAAKWATGFGVAALAVGGAMLSVATKASETASAINDMSARTGIATDTLQELKFASEQVGVNFESMTNASAKLNKMMADAAGGSKKARTAFEELKVEYQDGTGKLRAMGDVFPEVLTKLADMENKSERNALAMQVFGKGAVELVPLLDQGSVGIEELTKKAHDLGLVMSEEAVQAGDKFGDSLDQVKASFGSLGTEVGVAFMPLFQGLFDWVLKNMPAFREFFTKALGAVNAAFTEGGKIVSEKYAPVFKELWRVLNESVLPMLKELYEFIKPTFPIIGIIITTAMDAAVISLKAVIWAVEKISNAIQIALSWINKFNATPVKQKETGVNFIDNNQNKSILGGMAGFADGTDFAPGGSALVGERGPEIVNLPRGSRVIPNHELGAGKEVTINVPVYLDGNVIARIIAPYSDKLQGANLAFAGRGAGL
jgi:phage-related protein